MSQASKVISVASREVGYRAQRAPGERPSGHQKYSGQVPGLEWSNYQPWCATFTSWVALKAGVSSLFPRTASVWSAMQWFRNKGRWSAYPAVGAQVIYGTTGSTHTGLCVGYDETWIYTVEGNTSTTNDANGNGVMARKRRRRDTYVHGYGLPAYSEGIVTADPALKGRAGFTYKAEASGPTTGSGGARHRPRASTR
ncbi:C40 family peptidase [Streptomyces halobius]|uniref:CHAP domain-containing protein n=1 Tax=Streptomyces halobius TaxID=2879846 RepID=A0ABY4M314_9ACTN|nr:CHAP domain-containing protein [Streptomyces halobius]UQA92165.1 CHAP domain-containing protein [Streptomyces halobius]